MGQPRIILVRMQDRDEPDSGWVDIDPSPFNLFWAAINALRREQEKPPAMHGEAQTLWAKVSDEPPRPSQSDSN